MSDEKYSRQWATTIVIRCFDGFDHVTTEEATVEDKTIILPSWTAVQVLGRPIVARSSMHP